MGIRTPGLCFEFIDVLLGVVGMYSYRRETGAVVVDVVESDANGSNGEGKVVQALYGEPVGSNRRGQSIRFRACGLRHISHMGHGVLELS